MKLQAIALAAIVLVSVAITNNIYLLNESKDKVVVKASDVSAGVLGAKTNVSKKNENNEIDNLNLGKRGQEASNNSSGEKIISTSSIEGNATETIKTISNITIQNNAEPVSIEEKKDADVFEKPAISLEKTPSGICSLEESEISANIFLAQDINSGEVFFEKNSNYRWPIASISKLMSAIVVLDQYDFSKNIEITEDIIKMVSPYNTLNAGERYSTNDVLRAMIIASSNDAAYALANVIGEKKFVYEMNRKAKEIGMDDTIFWEPSGLSYLNQSTANDLFKLISYIYNNYPNLLATTRKKSVYIYDLAHRKRRLIKNTDVFAGMKNFYGGKTGFIDESGENLLTLFQKDGRIVAIMVLGSNNRFGDVERLYNCIE